MTLDVPIDFSESESISIKTWSPKADIPVRLKLEGSAGEVLELDVNTTVENQWETLTWDFTGQTGEVEWLTVVLFFEFVVDLPGDGSTYYYDDIQVAAPEEELLELPERIRGKINQRRRQRVIRPGLVRADSGRVNAD